MESGAVMSVEQMKIEVLYFDGCPSWQNGLKNLRAALLAEGIDAEVKLIRVESDKDAAREKFLGSPSFRVNGQDLWPEDREKYFLGCRVYATEAGMRGYPNIELLREKIRSYHQPESE